MKKVSVSAPCRVDFSGGTVDLWPLYLYLGGLELVHMAINVMATATIRFEKKTKGPLHIEIYSHDLKVEHQFNSVEELRSSVQSHISQNSLRWVERLVLYYLDKVTFRGHFRIETKSQTPPGSGLGGSSVLGVAIAQALEKVLLPTAKKSKPWDLQQLVRNLEAIEIEHPAGDQDYVPALFKGLLVFHLGVETRRVEKLSPRVATDLGRRCALLYTGKPHHSGINNWQIFTEFHNGNLKTKLALEKIRNLSSELAAELRAGKIQRFPQLLNNEWALRQELAPAVNAPELEEAWAYGKSLGASARKGCGAGGGGCLLLYFDSPKQRAAAMAQAFPAGKNWQWLSAEVKF